MELREAEQLAHRLITTHVLPSGWTFGWDNAVQRLGAAHYRERKITLSRRLTKASPESEVIDTILHECAHANAGAGAGHGPTWRAEARRLGARPEATANGANTPSIRVEQAPWVGVCPNGHEGTRYWRKPRVRRSCSICHPGAWDARFVFEYRRVDSVAGVR